MHHFIWYEDSYKNKYFFYHANGCNTRKCLHILQAR
jgi:hypothetical protein